MAIIGAPTLLTVHATFQHAWLFGAGCLLAAGLGCLFVEPTQAALSPGLAEAARTVFTRAEVPARAAAPPPARRTILAAGGVMPAPRLESVAEFLARVPLFESLSPLLRDELAARCRTGTVAAGAWLFREGEAGDALYVVRAGRLEVVDESSANILRELGRGDATGELALLTASPRSASVRAVRTSEVIVIDRDAFEAALVHSPDLSRALTRTLAEQLRDTRAPVPALRPRPVTVALVPLEEGLVLEPLAVTLEGALAAHAVVTRLTGREAESRAQEAAAAALYGPMLDRAEASSGLVLLQADPLTADSPWTRFCLQQADRILAVTRGGAPPSWLSEHPELRGCDLVALDVHRGGLAEWAAALDPIESHVVRSETIEQDVARTARRLCGISVGVVLSGGGARAFSHIGVLEELLAAGVTIDRIAGVSMGAVIGALFAVGHDPEQIDAICFEEWVQRRPLSDFTIPRHSLIRGERLRSMLHRQFGGWQVEDLPTSFMCGSAELRSGRLVMSRHGPLEEAVALSICLPIIGPPQVRGHELFIDGSLVDNLPVRPMAELGEGPIIAVDVKATIDGGGVERAHGDGHPGARAARPPGLGETLARVLLLGSANTSEMARRYADLLIKPRAPGVGLLEFHQIDAAREAGRAAAREALETAPEILFPSGRATP